MTRQRPLTTVAALAAARLISDDEIAALERVAQRYAVSITPAMADLIAAEGADPAALSSATLGPVTRQFVPSAAELTTQPDETADPIGDTAHSPVPGIVHRYPDRALLKLTGLCPVYCRFCFRRETVGPNNAGGADAMLPPRELDAALAYIAATPALWEIILTGGDPLILAPRRIADVTRRLADIAHVKVLRWHTRVPVVAPERVTPELVAALRSAGRAVYVGLHCNHPSELTPAARDACARLVDGGIVLVSQTVLLRGVNDDVATLDALMRAFVETRIKPYYLHHGDRAPGTANFRTTIAEGQALIRSLRGRLSGLAQPTYVLDLPGGFGKMPIGPGYVTNARGGYIIMDYQGQAHTYCECSPVQNDVRNDVSE
jgi:lysine 2,3-aminomutase